MMVEIIPTDEGVLSVFRGGLDVNEIAFAAFVLEAEIAASREAHDDLINALRTEVEKTGKQSAVFGNVKVTLSPRDVMLCGCHMDDVRRCDRAKAGEAISTHMAPVARYVRLSAVAP